MVNMATIVGIRRGELVEIIRVSFPAESLTEVENRDSISPCTIRTQADAMYLHLDQYTTDQKLGCGCR